MKVRLKILPNEPRSAAWPSSARGVSCPVKSGNERDPYSLLQVSSPDETHSVRTARVKWEEGEGDGRSVWPKSQGLHAAYNDSHNGLRLRKEELIPERLPQFGSRVATHPREAGIPSNRLSPTSGEYVPAPCTHRPSNHPSRLSARRRSLSLSNWLSVRGVKS